MAKFNLTTVRPKGFIHASAFEEVKSSLSWALTALGHEVGLTENAFSGGAQTNVIFGAELLSPGSKVPENSIIYNFEQPSHPNLPNVRELSKRCGCKVWDYSARNLPAWQAEGIDAIHVPVGYTPNLTRIPHSESFDWDLCLFAWMTPRRREMVQALKREGLRVFASDCCYGGARDNIISRSRAGINIHHDGRDCFEIVRVSYFLANGKFVISEPSSDDDDYSDLRHGIFFTPYESMVETCVRLLKNGK